MSDIIKTFPFDPVTPPLGICPIEMKVKPSAYARMVTAALWPQNIKEGNGNPPQYSCLENPMDRGAWPAIVYGFTKRWTQLSDWATQQLSIYPEKTIIWKDTGILMFIAALFTTARTWKQPTCPLADERMKEMWYNCTVEYYLAIKRDEFESIEPRACNTEWSKPQRETYCVLTHIHGI